ncbi:serine hydrolase domain-containing protein [Actinoallomurus iriomotensis]|uniref:D-alanyl-D-alanine carboxypeptidase n=1 Tax=Actinoallomurus iriomotensis TaxID=478107 RepID=A0A9W6VTI9_9ACTN|nr:serine hydrolase domain-containing protein [Actinoallomurus iriomotensis]GLY79179.1 D-alanyl-D-alanine carboxypeptidase [Actinoallomurus iriomotensis]
MKVLIAEAGYRTDEPIVVGLQQEGAPSLFVTQGRTSSDDPATATTLVYAASLSKQMTAACAALLSQHGELDIETPLSQWLPQLPAWARMVRLRHLLHHTAGLPADSKIDAHSTLDYLPGTEHSYSNAGYVCLAAAVERAADQPLPDFAHHRFFTPLGMAATRYWTGPHPPAGAAPLAYPHPAPLSLGDGGVWTTATDLLRWSHALNVDELGISALMQTPGHLDDGTPIDYAWGIGVRSHAGHRLYRHGGGWPGLRNLLARIPDLDLSLVVTALADHTERRVDLLNNLLDEITEADLGR